MVKRYVVIDGGELVYFHGVGNGVPAGTFLELESHL
jgi:hypothetical protein